MSDLFVARTSGVVMHDGRRHMLRRGVTVARAGHPLLEGHRHLFQPLTVHYESEQATAAPGEKRNVSTGKKKAKKKDAATEGDEA